MYEHLALDLEDSEWPFDYIDHDRQIVRAIVFDTDYNFYFVRVQRNDDFGKATLIETSGGGVEAGEELCEAICRELKEELGADVDIICELGVVKDYYNLIHRHNINHYFLCKIKSFGATNMTKDEIEDFHLSTLMLNYQDAVNEYERCSDSKLGRLVAKREVPVLQLAWKIICDNLKIK